MIKSFIVIFLILKVTNGCYNSKTGIKSHDFLIIRKRPTKSGYFSDNKYSDDEDEGFIYKKGTESYGGICGIENPSGKRILGGQLAKPHQFPWMVHLIAMNDELQWLCSSCIITQQWILTAAHCIEEVKSLDVYLGTNNITEDEEPNRIVSKAVQFIKHPRYKVTNVPGSKNEIYSVENDIALIQLDNKINFNHFIRPICLPSYTDAKSSFTGKKALAAGWGKTSDQTSHSTKLRYVDQLAIISLEECQNDYSIITKGFTCISSKDGKGICSGDSGGPLSFKMKNGRYMVIGTASFTSARCENRKPHSYAQVTYKNYLRWIETVTGLKIKL